MKRPALLEFSSLSELYLHFERIFLRNGATNDVVSLCGHSVRIFDHHFFHMVKLDHPAKPKPLLMANEKETILSTKNGFGAYTHDKQRAIYLESVMLCLREPDEVWDDPTLATARWIYMKHFETAPYSCTILLIGERENRPVLVTSFAAKTRDAIKWRRGAKIYP